MKFIFFLLTQKGVPKKVILKYSSMLHGMTMLITLDG